MFVALHILTGFVDEKNLKRKRQKKLSLFGFALANGRGMIRIGVTKIFYQHK